jgi:hypothetical protein
MEGEGYIHITREIEVKENFGGLWSIGPRGRGWRKHLGGPARVAQINKTRTLKSAGVGSYEYFHGVKRKTLAALLEPLGPGPEGVKDLML